MIFKEFEHKEILNTVFANPNIKQAQLARKLNTTPRVLRFKIHQIRLNGVIELGGKSLYLVGDNDGYSIVEVNSERFAAWKKRFSHQVKEMNEVLAAC